MGVTCTAQAGYNLLYGCWKYSWDADCELFLKILRGEVKEDVYVEQIQLQVSGAASVLALAESHLFLLPRQCRAPLRAVLSSCLSRTPLSLLCTAFVSS